MAKCKSLTGSAVKGLNLKTIKSTESNELGDCGGRLLVLQRHWAAVLYAKCALSYLCAVFDVCLAQIPDCQDNGVSQGTGRCVYTLDKAVPDGFGGYSAYL